MNYMAVMGTLVRAYLYKGDYVKAFEYARLFYNRFMKGGKNLTRGVAAMPYSAKTAYSNSLTTSNYRQKKTGNEILLAFSNADLIEIVEDYFEGLDESKGEGLPIARFSELFTNDNDDHRKTYLFENYGTADKNGQRPAKLIKYRSVEGGLTDEHEGKMISILRMTEVVYALIECEYRVGDGATAAQKYLKELRTAKGCKRNITAAQLTSLDVLLDILVNDMTRETVGEGQMFFTHKRLGRPFVDPNGALLDVTNERVVFDIPESQYVN